MKKIRVQLFALCLLLVVLLATSCGDYNSCHALAMRVCNECPNVSDAWQAACLCIDNDTVKEKGYKCITPTEEDKVRCNSDLENWDDQSCQLLN